MKKTILHSLILLGLVYTPAETDAASTPRKTRPPAPATSATSAGHTTVFAVTPPAWSYDMAEPPDESKKDPGYKLYKSGYNLILDEEWSEARKKFAEVVQQYPQSEYVDEAEYWSAFALEHLDDADRAFKAFKSFIGKYPESSYYDDAVSEMYKLKGSTISIGTLSGTAPKLAHGGTTVSGVFVNDSGTMSITPVARGGFKYHYEVSPTMRQTARALRRLERPPRPRSPLLVLTPGTRGTPVPAPLIGFPGDDEHLDPETKLRIEALSALGETTEDSLSYAALREVAYDPRQAVRLRQTAMEALANFKKFDVLKVFVEVAMKDTSEEIQNFAIDYIGQLSSDKDRSISALVELFSSIPSYRLERQQAILGSIGEIGNKRAVNFLAKIAKTHDNYALRSDAVYYLGNIGGTEARQALYEILKGK